METAEEYLTIQQAAHLFGKSDETIRRFIRLVRATHQVDLEDTNDQLEEKTPALRKQNVATDKNGVQIFDWLLSKAVLEEHFKEEPTQSPTHEYPQPPTDDPHDHTRFGSEDEHGDTPNREEGSQGTDEGNDEEPLLENDHTREDTHRLNDDAHNLPHEDPHNRNEAGRREGDLMTVVVEALREELGAKNEQIKQLHVLLRQAQEKIPQLPSPKRYDQGEEG